MYAYYAKTLAALLEQDPDLRVNFDNSVFAGVTFNLGPQVSTIKHRDHLNLPAGWCAVLAFGDFDPTQGGHLILWDLNLMIEFPLALLYSSHPPSSCTRTQPFDSTSNDTL